MTSILLQKSDTKKCGIAGCNNEAGLNVLGLGDSYNENFVIYLCDNCSQEIRKIKSVK